MRFTAMHSMDTAPKDRDILIFDGEDLRWFVSRWYRPVDEAPVEGWVVAGTELIEPGDDDECWVSIPICWAEVPGIPPPGDV